MKNLPIILSVFVSVLVSCDTKKPYDKTETISTKHHLGNTIKTEAEFKIKKVYVPIYSHIYQRTRNERTLLTSTLSIHNTSETDTLFISRIDYYNTKGKLVRKHIKAPIFLNTLQTLEYMVDQGNETSGSGANFIIEWYGSEKLNPIFQAVMVGGLGNKSFLFTTEGVEIE
ncbi:DUF3124 domain-containing protein [uncultured Gelidibacter sp.]|uniref:DUF3124 domain-containing protein n=1 Tax=uncultured Gelidibacter sp. TaxID=259318 RepID=UPI00260ED329|nr:DUF3124 domain-containing protein [uncultured Gelidibacter sp.]